jgi:hypothetical protein
MALKQKPDWGEELLWTEHAGDCDSRDKNFRALNKEQHNPSKVLDFILMSWGLNNL